MKLTFLCIHDLKWPHYYCCCISTKNLMFPIPLFVRVLSTVNHILRWFICCLKVDLKVKNQVKAPLQFTPYKCHRHNRRIGKIQIAEYDNWKRSESLPLWIWLHTLYVCGQAISIFKTFFFQYKARKNNTTY